MNSQEFDQAFDVFWIFILLWGFFISPVLDILLQSKNDRLRRIGMTIFIVCIVIVSITILLLFVAALADKSALMAFTMFSLILIFPLLFFVFKMTEGNNMVVRSELHDFKNPYVKSFSRKYLLIYVIAVAFAWIFDYLVYPFIK